ncbi:MAG: nucleotide excision repair endonuclease [Acidobacteria bacterium]|nr:nucleotide excision repair endonuclease [Acidobacteriota bacterium]
MLLRDRLLARLAESRGAPDYAHLAADVLGIRGAPPALARRLVEQALVMEDRRDAWRAHGARICAQAPPSPGVYVLRDAAARAVYVGKAVNLRRRLRAHFANRTWRRLKIEMSRVVSAEWEEVGSELEALLREAAAIAALRPAANVQTGSPALASRAVPPALARDVLVVVPSREPDSVELVAARADGGWLIQRTRRSGGDLAVHAARVFRFFNALLRRGADERPLAPIVFSWLAGRGVDATRLDPHDVRSPRELRARLIAVLGDDRLFIERIDQRRVG